DWPALLCDRLLESLPDPRVRPGQERHAPGRVVPLHRAHDSERHLLLEVDTTHAAALVGSRKATQSGIGELNAASSCVVIARAGGVGRALDTRVVIHASG